jgi:hypothetical protein
MLSLFFMDKGLCRSARCSSGAWRISPGRRMQ